jgi:hypothetical protein
MAEEAQSAPVSAPKRPPRCTCGQQHRTWFAVAECLYKRSLWVRGNGPFATVSSCAPGISVLLHNTEDEARKALALIDELSCGGSCHKAHRLVDLRDALNLAGELEVPDA